MNVREAIRVGTAVAGRRDALLLLEKVCGSVCLYNEDAVLPTEAHDAFTDMLEQRKQHKPVQYILGEWEFMGLPFSVGPAVLIPRADTETLVETALAYIQARPRKSWRVLDCCTGSGCIGIALAYLCPDAFVTASDISPDALTTAANNAVQNGVRDRMAFVLSDMFSAIKDSFDLILSNPPYIPTDELTTLSDDVRLYEPLSALDGGADGLRFYRPLAAHGRSLLNPGGALLLEVGPTEAVTALLQAHGFDDVFVKRDYTGAERVTGGIVR